MYLFPGINYTIMMDGAPGPVGDPLKIGVVPNPVFTSINRNALSSVNITSLTINVGVMVAIEVIDVMVM